MFKILTIAILLTLSSCIVKKNATLIGYENDRMILVTSDTISYGSNKKGKIGDGYTVLYRGNKVLRVQPVKK